jgi:hypothetical protein
MIREPIIPLEPINMIFIAFSPRSSPLALAVDSLVNPMRTRLRPIRQTILKHGEARAKRFRRARARIFAKLRIPIVNGAMWREGEC